MIKIKWLGHACYKIYFDDIQCVIDPFEDNYVPGYRNIDTSADIILATGGPGMVKAAYSSGKPALGVGAGNTPAIIDDSADILLAVNSIIHSKYVQEAVITMRSGRFVVPVKK